ncbi:MAG: 50S ribosomal protein L24 [Candidatus Protistobacter heckmanni]|nr:50S ribosomal protein L24 [Candidatus Protistobacter heckmanni]
MNKIRKGDEVIVITGKDKGKRGTVLTVAEQTVTVEGVNVVKKNTRPNPALGVQGGIVDKTMPIQISNVALVDANGKPSRVAIKVEGGKKVRVLKTTGAVLAA